MADGSFKLVVQPPLQLLRYIFDSNLRNLILILGYLLSAIIFFTSNSSSIEANDVNAAQPCTSTQPIKRKDSNMSDSVKSPKEPLSRKEWIAIAVVVSILLYLGFNLFSNNSGCLSCDDNRERSKTSLIDLENPSGDCGPGGNDACPG